MEKNTVCLDLQAYNELKAFEESVMVGNICAITTYHDEYSRPNTRFYTESEAVKLISETNETLINVLSKTEYVLKKAMHIIETLSEGSIWSFRRWRRNYMKTINGE